MQFCFRVDILYQFITSHTLTILRFCYHFNRIKSNFAFYSFREQPPGIFLVFIHVKRFVVLQSKSCQRTELEIFNTTQSVRHLIQFPEPHYSNAR